MTRNFFCGLLLFSVCAAGAAAAPVKDAGASDWPQLQYDAQHTGCAPDCGMRMPERPAEAGSRWNEFKVGWVQDFEKFVPPQHISRVTQIIAYAGKLFIPTMEGRLYALNAADGTVLCFFDCGEGVMHTAAAADGRVFFAGINGGVFAVDAGTGTELWHWRPAARDGFSAAVLLAEDKLFLGSRAGRMRAFSQTDGALLWEAETDGPIYQTAAYNAGRVYAGAEDMHAYCWRASDGAVVWKSKKLNGQSFRDYYPLVCKGKVFFESQHAWSALNCVVPAYGAVVSGMFPLDGIFDYEKEFAEWLKQHGEAMAEGKPDEESLRDIREAQEHQLALFDQFPHENLRHVLEEETGEEKTRLPLFIQSMCGNQPPPTVDRDGMLILPVAFFNNRYGRFDLELGQYIDMLMGIGQWAFGGDQTSMARGGNHDEVNNVSTAGPLIFNIHSLEHGGISGQGVYCLDSRRWGTVEVPAGSGGWHVRMPNVQCGGNAASIAYGAAYHHVYGLVHNWVPSKGK